MAAKRRAPGKRPCEKCQAPATGRREGGQWIAYKLCKPCLAMARIGDVVRGLRDHELRYHATELRLLRELEAEVVAQGFQPEGTVGKLMRDLQALREIQHSTPEG